MSICRIFRGIEELTYIAGNLNCETNGSSAICSSIKEGTDPSDRDGWDMGNTQ